MRKERGHMPVVTEPQQDQVEHGGTTTPAKKVLEGTCIMFRRLLRAGQIGRHGKNMIAGDQRVPEQRLEDHFIVTAIVVGGHETFVTKKEVSS
jgi:hypothetical protein